MMTTRKKQQIRVTVADLRGCRHSAVWKFKSHGDEIYILAEGLGAELKTSLHSSGKARHAFISQALSDRWREPGSDRAIAKWQSPWPTGEASRPRLLAEVIVPESHMQTAGPPRVVEDKGLVIVKAPPIGWATSLLLFELDPDAEAPPQIAAQLAVGTRKLGVAAHYEKFTRKKQQELQEVREMIESTIRQTEDNGQPEGDLAFRCALYLGSNDGVGRVVDIDVSGLFDSAQ